ncbi:MAG: sulfite exporter TauE/SafE family protein [Actinobacteria bacterium]|nr:sulfite exporter TauE/SafE family protein [Actinomycetota bacterium]
MLVSVIAGLVIGVILGTLGGGGAILALPVLVFALGVSPHDAATASLIIVGITSAIALVEHARAGRVRWRDGLVFGIVGIVGTSFGTYLGRNVHGQALLLSFAALLIVVAIVMWRRSGASRATAPGAAVAPGAAEKGVAAGTARAADASPEAAPATASRASTTMAAATVVGLLTGFFGVGGGFAVVPTLVIALGFAMREAVATSLLILTLNTGSALVARAVGEGIHVDWGIIAPFTVATVVGSFVGARLGPRLPERSLQRAFALLLVLVAVYTAWKSLT